MSHTGTEGCSICSPIRLLPEQQQRLCADCSEGRPCAHRRLLEQ
jgi:hypothetical protein